METGGRKLNKAVIVTKSTNFEPRAEIVGEYLESQDVDVTYIYSDYSHREKKHLERNEAGHIYVETYPYKKNLSWQRMWSQADFAKKVGQLLKGMDYDLLYVLIPGNVLVPMAVKAAEEQRKKSGKSVKLVIDIIDLWPESLRLGKLENVWPVTIWKNLRDKNLDKAELIITECDLYREKLGLDPNKSVTMYWGKKDTSAEWADQEESNQKSETESDGKNVGDKQGVLQLAYLGAINNIIDIDGIVKLLKKLNQEKPVLLHVIGDGENKESFLQALKECGISYDYHGVIFDEAEKHRILKNCSYGLNMMKAGVCVGMTMKSIDYWSHGLPIINNIPGDSWRLCDEDGMGVNLDQSRNDLNYKVNNGSQTIEEIVTYLIVNRFINSSNRMKIKEVFNKCFTDEAMTQVIANYVLNQHEI